MRTRYHHLLVYLSSFIFLLGAGAEEIKKAGESYKQVEQRLQKHSVDDGKTDFFTKSVGGVSKRRTGFRSVLEHDVMTRPELCGGPVFDLSGALIGMNIARYDRGSTYVLPVTAFRKGL